jgi:hypothetical protein
MNTTRTHAGQSRVSRSGTDRPGDDRQSGIEPPGRDHVPASERSQDIRPIITRHRLRRQRRRTAATLLAGASMALAVAALRSENAAAHVPHTRPGITEAQTDCDLPHSTAPG